MDWIHCNSCFKQTDDDGTKLQFLLTSCGHIFCENCGCFEVGTTDSCKSCRSKCSYTQSFRTNPQVLEYFQEPEEVCKKLLKGMQYQQAHRTKLADHHRRILSKYNRAKAYIKKLENELKIAKNTLRNIPQTPKPAYCVTTPSITTPIFHPNSTPAKIINAKSKTRNTPKTDRKTLAKIFDVKHRKQSFRNELSLVSSGSSPCRFQTPGSSVFVSPLHRSYDDSFMPTIDNLQLLSFKQCLLKK